MSEAFALAAKATLESQGVNPDSLVVDDGKLRIAPESGFQKPANGNTPAPIDTIINKLGNTIVTTKQNGALIIENPADLILADGAVAQTINNAVISDQTYTATTQKSFETLQNNLTSAFEEKSVDTVSIKQLEGIGGRYAVKIDGLTSGEASKLAAAVQADGYYAELENFGANKNGTLTIDASERFFQTGRADSAATIENIADSIGQRETAIQQTKEVAASNFANAANTLNEKLPEGSKFVFDETKKSHIMTLDIPELSKAQAQGLADALDIQAVNISSNYSSATRKVSDNANLIDGGEKFQIVLEKPEKIGAEQIKNFNAKLDETKIAIDASKVNAEKVSEFLGQELQSNGKGSYYLPHEFAHANYASDGMNGVSGAAAVINNVLPDSAKAEGNKTRIDVDKAAKEIDSGVTVGDSLAIKTQLKQPIQADSKFKKQTEQSEDMHSLFIAVRSGDLNKVNALLEKDQNLLTSVDRDGNTPLHIAAANGNNTLTKALTTQMDLHGQVGLREIKNYAGATAYAVAASALGTNADTLKSLKPDSLIQNEAAEAAARAATQAVKEEIAAKAAAAQKSFASLVMNSIDPKKSDEEYQASLTQVKDALKANPALASSRSEAGLTARQAAIIALSDTEGKMYHSVDKERFDEVLNVVIEAEKAQNGGKAINSATLKIDIDKLKDNPTHANTPELKDAGNDVEALDKLKATGATSKSFELKFNDDNIFAVNKDIAPSKDAHKETAVATETDEKAKPGFFEKMAENNMAWGLIGGIAALLLTGGGGMGSFLIAGIVALVAAFAGPALMKNFMGGDDDLPAHGLSNENIKKIDGVGQAPSVAPDGKVNLADIAKLAGPSGKDDKFLLGADDFKSNGLSDKAAEKAMEYVLKQNPDLKPDEKGYVDVRQASNPNLTLPNLVEDKVVSKGP